MKSIKQVWEDISMELEQAYDAHEARGIARVLLEDVFHVSSNDLFLNEPSRVNDGELRKYIDRLLNFEPVQYVTGVAHFYNRRFHVKPGVLIPRPETEELIQLIVTQNRFDSPKILDVGTGSGCIAVSLALELNTKVLATDVSEEALIIAQSNAELLGASCEFSRNDALKEKLPHTGLDILVSNPPYIPELDKSEMHANVLAFEPKQALFVPDDDPLIFYRRISESGRNSLKPNGQLYFEIHEKYGNELKIMVEELGYSDVLVHKDMQGKDRMLSAINSTSK